MIFALLRVSSSVMSRPLGSGADGRVDALIAAAATEIAGHGAGDLGVCRRRLLGEKGRGLHDLPGLAVAALRHADIAPGDLDDVLALGMQTLDRDDRLSRRLRHLHHARAHGLALEMHRAGPAQADAAPELGAGHPGMIAQIPKERHRRVAVVAALLPIYFQACHLGSSFWPRTRTQDAIMP